MADVPRNVPADNQPPQSPQPQPAPARRGKKRSSEQKIEQLIQVQTISALSTTPNPPRILLSNGFQKLLKMEEAEVEDEHSYSDMDKIRNKVLQIQKALYDAGVYQVDSTYDAHSYHHTPTQPNYQTPLCSGRAYTAGSPWSRAGSSRSTSSSTICQRPERPLPVEQQPGVVLSISTQPYPL